MKRELDIVLPPPPPVPKKLKREQNIVKQEAGTLDPAEGDDFEDNVTKMTLRCPIYDFLLESVDPQQVPGSVH